MIDWNKVMVDAAIAVLPKSISICQDVLMRGGQLTENTLAEQAAVTACDYAGALVNKLKSLVESPQENSDVPQTEEQKKDFRKESIRVVGRKINEIDVSHLMRSGVTKGYEARFLNYCRFNSIENVGQLLHIGRKSFGESMRIGKKTLEVVDEALLQLYGIKFW